jgi:hypothetical protein
MATRLTRREILAQGVGVAATLAGTTLRGADEEGLRLATFQAEVTVPLKHPLMGGGIAPAKSIEDPLYVHGLIWFGAGKPVVLAVVDWCEIRNDAYDRWRSVLAEAAETTPDRVMISSVHQHDAPVADLEAQRILEAAKAAGAICDIEYHEKTVQRVARAVREGLKTQHKLTHISTGQARVDRVASNRRFPGPDGRILFSRTSATRDPKAREQPEGTIDPWLKTIGFWNGDQPIAALSCYATHPMSYYGKGGVSSDFTGMARKRRQSDEPKCLQMYASGCSGNVTAGKYNDGSPDNRPILADRIYQAMVAANRDSKKEPLATLRYRTIPLRLEPRNDPGFTIEDLRNRVKEDPKPFGQCLAALGLSWRKRADAGHKLDVDVLELGNARLLLLPAEAYVEYQLLAQKQRPDLFVMTLGYGECAPGYIPTEKAVKEHDSNLSDWCWVAPGAEAAMTKAIEEALGKMQ